jgi:hypothetical protein
MLYTILGILVGLWLLKGLFDLSVGLGQILLGLLSGIAGVILIILSYIVEGFEKLWDIATRK